MKNTEADYGARKWQMEGKGREEQPRRENAEKCVKMEVVLVMMIDYGDGAENRGLDWSMRELSCFGGMEIEGPPPSTILLVIICNVVVPSLGPTHREGLI